MLLESVENQLGSRAVGAEEEEKKEEGRRYGAGDGLELYADGVGGKELAPDCGSR